MFDFIFAAIEVVQFNKWGNKNTMLRVSVNKI